MCIQSKFILNVFPCRDSILRLAYNILFNLQIIASNDPNPNFYIYKYMCVYKYKKIKYAYIYTHTHIFIK